MVAPALIAAGISAAASLAGGIFGNKASAKEAQKNRDWQADMSNTAHQREVADLRAAGLNPMLSAKLGGASTPSGSTAIQSDPVTPAVNSANQSYRSSIEMENAKAQLENIKAQTADAQASAASKQADADLTRQHIVESQARVPTYAGQLEQSIASAASAREQANLTKNIVGKVLAETANIKSDTVRLQEATRLLREQIISAPIDRAHTSAAALLIQAKITGQDVDNIRNKMGVGSDFLDIEYKKLGIPKALNESEAQRGFFKHDVSPYLDDLGKIINSARGATGAR